MVEQLPTWQEPFITEVADRHMLTADAETEYTIRNVRGTLHTASYKYKIKIRFPFGIETVTPAIELLNLKMIPEMIPGTIEKPQVVIFGLDNTLDLALLRIPVKTELPYVQMSTEELTAEAEHPGKGTTLYGMVAFALSHDRSSNFMTIVTLGSLLALKNVQGYPVQTFELKMRVAKGYSGAGILTEKGELAGILWGRDDTSFESYPRAYVVPISVVRTFYEKVKKATGR